MAKKGAFSVASVAKGTAYNPKAHMSWSEILDAGNFPSNLFRTSFQVPTIIETTTATATYQKGLSLFLEPSLKTGVYSI